MQDDSIQLPHSKSCVGCHAVTFRNRPDGLCPRCAWSAESLIEQIEIDSLESDLELLTAFDAYCDMRDRVMRGGHHDESTPIPGPNAQNEADLQPAAFRMIANPTLTFSRPFGFGVTPWTDRWSA